MNLDDEDSILHIDKKQMFQTLNAYPKQIEETKTIIEQSNLPKIYNIHHIIVSGMGGSAISGDILQYYTEEKGFLPISVYRTYHLPKWINKNTFIFVQSYSGNTEEILSAFKQAYEKRCPMISITSNGKLQEYSDKRQVPCVIIPKGLEPRSALCYLFFSSLLSLQKIGIFNNVIQKEIEESIDVTTKLIEKIKPSIPTKNNQAKEIAISLIDSIPQIYGWEIYTPIAKRWATQINENSKMIAGFNTIPEANHNDIVGWSEHNKAKQFSVILFRDSQLESLQMKTRLDFMKTFYQQQTAQLIEVHPQGKSILAKMMYNVVLGDYISYYLAILQQKDPSSVSIINQLKDTLYRL